MALGINVFKQELRELKEQRAELDNKIKALEVFVGVHKQTTNKNSSTGTPSVRGGVDIRPAVISIFQKNGNQPMKVKDMVDAVAKELPDADKEVIKKKMVYAIRKLLEKGETYGTYRLKPNTS